MKQERFVRGGVRWRSGVAKFREEDEVRYRKIGENNEVRYRKFVKIVTGNSKRRQ